MKSKRSQHLISIALTLLAYFGCQAQELPSAKKFSNQENIELRQLIEQEPPTNLPYGKLSEFFQKQEEASFKLNDQNSREKILRNWMKAQPENISPRWNLGMSLIFVGGRAQEGFELMEQIYRDTTITKDAIATIRVRIKLAEAYLE